MKETLDVAVGVVYDGRGRVLVAQRSCDRSFAGAWEFPGGKIEAGESPDAALARELIEELGITVAHQRPLISLRHSYEDFDVRLRVNEVLAFKGHPRGLEGQPLQWVEPGKLRRIDLLAANGPIVRAILLPRTCMITDARQFGEARTLDRLAQHLKVSRILVIVREKTMDRDRLAAFVARIRRLCQGSGSLVCVHADCDSGAFAEADGVHLSARRLRDGNGPDRGRLLGASCHSRAEIQQARRRGADYLLLSPVRRTASHPKAEPLGWDGFAGLCREASLPVYALGGMQLSDFETAIGHGAQGVAILSAAWQ